MFSCFITVQPQMSPKCTGITLILHPTVMPITYLSPDFDVIWSKQGQWVHEEHQGG